MDYAFEHIASSKHLVPFSTNYKIKQFDCGIEEYNDFLTKEAEYYQQSGISKTHLLLDNATGDVVGYFSLSAAAIRLTKAEKAHHGMDVPFASIPVMKIGKLAVDKNYRDKLKGYGSFLVILARGYAIEMNSTNVACKFIVVDADLQYDNDTIKFYKKNGFLLNESYGGKEVKRTIGMRLDIMENIEECEKTGT